MTNRIVYIGLLLLVLGITNRWLSYEDGVALAGARDTRAYMSIAAAAPQLPHEPWAYHYAQRLAVPYAVGIIAHVAGFAPENVFLASTLFLTFIIALVYHKILSCLRPGLSGNQYALCMGLLILNPYVFRPYLAVPCLAIDLMFVAGLSILILGLLRRDVKLVLGGALLAALARQTALLMIPVATVWIIRSANWKEKRSLVRAGCAAALALIIAGTYVLTGIVAKSFSGPDVNMIHVTGLFEYFTKSFQPHLLVPFAIRATIPFIFPVGCLAAVALASFKQIRTAGDEFWFCLALTLSICTQPILGGPIVIGDNVTRLDALGMIPLLTALGILLASTGALNESMPTLQYAIAAILTAGSFHYFYAFMSERRDLGPYFTFMYAVFGICLSFIVWDNARSRIQRSGQIK